MEDNPSTKKLSTLRSSSALPAPAKLETVCPQLHRERLLTRTQLAEIFGLSKRSLEVAAVKGNGPPMIKFGRSVYYRCGDYLDWIEAHRVTSTSAKSSSEGTR